MSFVTELGAPWTVDDHGLVATGDVCSIRLGWRPIPGMVMYQVHGVPGVRTDWAPTSQTLLGITSSPRFVHGGLGAAPASWSYRVVALGAARRMTPVATARSQLSVTLTGRPLVVVGAFDGSGRDLAMSSAGFVHYLTTFPSDVDFHHGVDRPEQAWSYVQPGPDDAWAGRRAHRFRLRFDLEALPAHDVDLALWLVDRHPTRAGSAALSINDVRLDSFLLDSDPARGDSSGGKLVMPGLGAGPAYFERPIPRTTLRLGENVLDIAKDQGHWIAYDAIGLFART